MLAYTCLLVVIDVFLLTSAFIIHRPTMPTATRMNFTGGGKSNDGVTGSSSNVVNAKFLTFSADGNRKSTTSRTPKSHQTSPTIRHDTLLSSSSSSESTSVLEVEMASNFSGVTARSASTSNSISKETNKSQQELQVDRSTDGSEDFYVMSNSSSSSDSLDTFVDKHPPEVVEDEQRFEGDRVEKELADYASINTEHYDDSKNFEEAEDIEEVDHIPSGSVGKVQRQTNDDVISRSSSIRTSPSEQHRLKKNDQIGEQRRRNKNVKLQIGEINPGQKLSQVRYPNKLPGHYHRHHQGRRKRKQFWVRHVGDVDRNGRFHFRYDAYVPKTTTASPTARSLIVDGDTDFRSTTISFYEMTSFPPAARLYGLQQPDLYHETIGAAAADIVDPYQPRTSVYHPDQLLQYQPTVHDLSQALHADQTATARSEPTNYYANILYQQQPTGGSITAPASSLDHSSRPPTDVPGDHLYQQTEVSETESPAGFAGSTGQRGSISGSAPIHRSGLVAMHENDIPHPVTVESGFNHVHWHAENALPPVTPASMADSQPRNNAPSPLPSPISRSSQQQTVQQHQQLRPESVTSSDRSTKPGQLGATSKSDSSPPPAEPDDIDDQTSNVKQLMRAALDNLATATRMTSQISSLLLRRRKPMTSSDIGFQRSSRRKQLGQRRGQNRHRIEVPTSSRRTAISQLRLRSKADQEKNPAEDKQTDSKQFDDSYIRSASSSETSTATATAADKSKIRSKTRRADPEVETAEESELHRDVADHVTEHVTMLPTDMKSLQTEQRSTDARTSQAEVARRRFRTDVFSSSRLSAQPVGRMSDTLTDADNSDNSRRVIGNRLSHEESAAAAATPAAVDASNMIDGSNSRGRTDSSAKRFYNQWTHEMGLLNESKTSDATIKSQQDKRASILNENHASAAIYSHGNHLEDHVTSVSLQNVNLQPVAEQNDTNCDKLQGDVVNRTCIEGASREDPPSRTARQQQDLSGTNTNDVDQLDIDHSVGYVRHLVEVETQTQQHQHQQRRPAGIDRLTGHVISSTQSEGDDRHDNNRKDDELSRRAAVTVEVVRLTDSPPSTLRTPPGTRRPAPSTVTRPTTTDASAYHAIISNQIQSRNRTSG